MTLIPSNTVVAPTFDAFVSEGTGTNLTFELTVENAVGKSDSATVNVFVKRVNQPPISDAGDDATIKEGATGALDGSNSFDPDGDPLFFLWTQQAGQTVTLIPNGQVANPSFTAPAAGNVLEFRLRVFDGFGGAGEDRVIITVVANSPPEADAGPDQTVTGGTPVTLDGSNSIDPDGDTLSFDWTGPEVLSDNTSPTPSFTAPAVGAGGAMLKFELTVTDSDLITPRSDTDEVVIRVQSANDPPNCGLATASCSASKIKNNNGCTLWPPNHKLVEVRITGVTDPDNNAVTIQITGVTQDEPVNDRADADTSPDAVISGDSVLIRAERTGLTGGAQENGRIYLVDFTADDGQGGMCSGSVSVGVPHDRKDTPVDDGQAYDSVQP